MKVDKNSVYWRLFSDLWVFFKLHMESTTRDGKRLISDAEALYGQYESLPQADFAQELVFSCMREVDRQNGNPREQNFSAKKGGNAYD